MDLNSSLSSFNYVAFDLETTGAYPLGSEIVEIGAVRWEKGQVTQTLNFLVKPTKPMSDFIIGIHGITNEMVQDLGPLAEVLPQVAEFFENSILLAHHAAFDLGFLAAAFEDLGIFPNQPILCTSKLGQALIRGTPNHKLQTLVKHFGIDPGQAHRATDDAQSCLQVALEIFRIQGWDSSLESLAQKMKGAFHWSDFLLKNAPDPIPMIRQAIIDGKQLEIVYQGGSLSGSNRVITPKGIVRSPQDGDWVSAVCHRDGKEKRFYLKKIEDVVTLSGKP